MNDDPFPFFLQLPVAEHAERAPVMVSMPERPDVLEYIFDYD
ncbi:hypothetical protein [Nonomuraea jabiensis]